MKKCFTIFVLLIVVPAITGFFRYGEAREAQNKELKPMVRVSPNELNFNCSIMERAKGISATNASTQTMTIKAGTTESWILIEPGEQPDV